MRKKEKKEPTDNSHQIKIQRENPLQSHSHLFHLVELPALISMTQCNRFTVSMTLLANMFCDPFQNGNEIIEGMERKRDDLKQITKKKTKI